MYICCSASVKSEGANFFANSHIFQVKKDTKFIIKKHNPQYKQLVDNGYSNIVCNFIHKLLTSVDKIFPNGVFHKGKHIYRNKKIQSFQYL